MYNKIYFKERAHAAVGPGKSAICRAGQQVGNSQAGTDTAGHRWDFFLGDTSALL